MKDEKKLTVIVNTYNSEKFLDQCLDSVIDQLNDKVELIVVDDSSTDKSPEIITDKIKDIKNANFYSVKHNGVSSSRNFGIDVSNGKYIIFVDGDDYLNDKSIEIILNYLKDNDYDLTLFNIVKYFQTDNYYVKEKFDLKENELLTESDLLRNKICGRPWRFIYKKEMIVNNNIRFPDGLTYEDEEWVPKVIYYANSINYLNEDLYVYRKWNGAITSTKNIEYVMSLAKIVEDTYNWSINCDYKEKYINYSLSRCIRNIISAIDDYSNIEDKNRILNWYYEHYDMILDILDYNKKMKFSIETFGPQTGIKVYKKVFKEKYSIKKEKVDHI